jgi:hypothetical protein
MRFWTIWIRIKIYPIVIESEEDLASEIARVS